MFNLDDFIKKYVVHREISMFKKDIDFYTSALKKAIEGKSMLVIGGAGSIGANASTCQYPSEIAALMAVLCGYLFYTIITQNGYSQVYFMFALFPYGMYLALNLIAKSDVAENQKRKQRWFKPTTAVMLIILIVGVHKTTEYYSGKVLLGLSNLKNRYISEKEYPGSSGNDVNKQELEALRWLRDNSDEDALLITNLAIINNTSFTTSCYAERQIYIEGEGYGSANQELQTYRVNLIKKYYLGDEEATEVLIGEGVDYAVVFASVPEYVEYVGNVIFENSAVKIIEMGK